MLYQKPYHHPYIPRSTALAPQPPYVGGELEQLTSSTPFYRGQGVPIYENTPVIRKMNFGAVNYGAAYTVGLKNGSKGASVGALQTKLKGLGYSVGSSGVDRDFGDDTEAALKKYQKDNKLPQTGILDAATFTALEGKSKTEEPEKVTGAAAISTLFSSFGQSFANTASQGTGGSTVNITTHQAKGMSSGAKVGLALGGFALIGMIVYVAVKE